MVWILVTLRLTSRVTDRVVVVCHGQAEESVDWFGARVMSMDSEAEGP